MNGHMHVTFSTSWLYRPIPCYQLMSCSLLFTLRLSIIKQAAGDSGGVIQARSCPRGGWTSPKAPGRRPDASARGFVLPVPPAAAPVRWVVRGLDDARPFKPTTLEDRGIARGGRRGGSDSFRFGVRATLRPSSQISFLTPSCKADPSEFSRGPGRSLTWAGTFALCAILCRAVHVRFRWAANRRL